MVELTVLLAGEWSMNILLLWNLKFKKNFGCFYMTFLRRLLTHALD